MFLVRVREPRHGLQDYIMGHCVEWVCVNHPSVTFYETLQYTIDGATIPLLDVVHISS